MIRSAVFCVILAGLGASGCDFVQDFSAAQDSQKKVEDALSEKLGGKVRVGWNIHNGTLNRVTVRVKEGAAGDLTLNELKARIAPVVVRHFEEKPSMLHISVAVPGQRL